MIPLGLLFGSLLVALGVLIGLRIIVAWIASGFGALAELRMAVLGFTIMLLGVITFFSAFFMSALGLDRT